MEISEIQNEIIAAKESKPELASLNSTSIVSVWRGLAYAVATVIYGLRTVWDEFRKEILTYVANSRIGSKQWYVTIILQFQYESDFVYDSITGKFGYAVDEPDKRIIKFCSIEDSTEYVLVKVAKADANGQPIVLTTNEKNALTRYINFIKFPGTFIQVKSLEADLLDVVFTIEYNGLYNPDTVKAQCRAAIETYLKNIDFNGVFVTNRMIDAVQTVKGVVDVIDFSGTNVSQNVGILNKVGSNSGYFKIRTFTDTYIPVLQNV